MQAPPPFGLSLHCVLPPENNLSSNPIFIAYDQLDKRCYPWRSLQKPICDIALSMGIEVRPYDPGEDIRWIHILLIAPSCLSNPAFFDTLPDCPLRSRVRPPERFQGQARGRFNPVLSISQEDFTEIFTILPQQTDTLLQSLKLDPRAKFLDASIWHRYVPEVPNDNTFAGLLRETLAELCSYWEHGLYYTVPAVSTLDFQLRMLRQSYIGPFGEGGHSEVVTPFKFHSERHLKKRIEQSEARFFLDIWDKKSLAETLCWRVLVVDDNADEVFSTVNNDKYRDWVNVKKQVLLRKPIDELYRKAVQQQAQSPDCLQDFDQEAKFSDLQKQFEVACPPTKKGVVGYCLEALKTQSYDILFLDYLLGERTDSTEREYGHEFLLGLIHGKDDPALRRDFIGRHWIFPISSFPFALPDKLVQLGIGHSLPSWRLSVGGDPVTTPHLYAYYLLRFMKARVAEYFLYPKAFGRLLNAAPHFSEDQRGEIWASLLDNALFAHINRIKVVKSGQKNMHDSRFLSSLRRFPAFDQLQKIAETARQVLSDVINIQHPFKYDTIDTGLAQIEREGGYRYEEVVAKFSKQITKYTKELGQEEAKRKIAEALKTGSSFLNLDNLYLSRLPQEIAQLSAQLTVLSLQNNRLSSWESLKILKQFPYLEKLLLKDNPPGDRPFPLVQEEIRAFLDQLP